MTASIRTELIEDVRQLVMTVTGATADKVIVAGDKGPRPAKPYVTVRVTSLGPPRGPAERIEDLAEDDVTPTTKMRERRESVVSLQGYGSGAALWFDRLQIGLDSPASLAKQEELELSALLQTPPTDIGTLLDTAEEQRFTMELRLRYRYQSDPADQVALERIEVSTELRRSEDDPDTLTADQVVEPD